MTTHDRDKVLAAAKEAGAKFDPAWGLAYNCGTETFIRFYAIAFEHGRQAAEIAELMTLLSRASVSIGSFVEGNDWAQSDMDTMDSIDALIYRKALAATEPKP